MYRIFIYIYMCVCVLITDSGIGLLSVNFFFPGTTLSEPTGLKVELVDGHVRYFSVHRLLHVQPFYTCWHKDM